MPHLVPLLTAAMVAVVAPAPTAATPLLASSEGCIAGNAVERSLGGCSAPRAVPPHPAAHNPHPPDLPLSAEAPSDRSPYRLDSSLAPLPSLLGGSLAGASAPAVTARIPVLLVDFPGRAADRDLHRPRAYRRMLFRDGYKLGAGSLRDYYQDQSGGRFDVTGEVSGWLRMPRRYDAYVGASNGYQSSEPNDETLVTDAVKAADGTVDFCDFDTDSDGYVDTLFVVHSGPGAEEIGTGIWSISWSLSVPFTTDDACAGGGRAKVQDFTIEPEEYQRGDLTAPGAPAKLVAIGVFVHEFGHTLGLPDLYDTDFSSPGGVGPWDVMATGTYGFDGSTPWRPTPMSAWTRAELGWAEVSNVHRDLLDLSLGPADALPGTDGAPGAYRLAKGGDPDATEYFLVENRPASGWGADFPGSGIAIWHIDATRGGNDNDGRHLVHLVQADGLNELGGSQDFFEAGDAGDLFRLSGNRRWDGSTTPSSDLYGNIPSGISVKITDDGDGRPLLDLLV